MAETKELDAVIVLGCVVRGDTPHFDYVCSGVTQGITELNLMYDIPFIFGLLTTDTMQQSEIVREVDMAIKGTRQRLPQ